MDYGEVSQLLKRSVNTLRRDVSHRRIPFLKIGCDKRGSVRFSREEILRWLKKREIKEIGNE